MAYYRYTKYTDAQVVREGVYFLTIQGGVSELSEFLHIPRSTAHYHISKRLSWIDSALYEQVKAKLEYNKHHKYRRK